MDPSWNPTPPPTKKNDHVPGANEVVFQSDQNLKKNCKFPLLFWGGVGGSVWDKDYLLLQLKGLMYKEEFFTLMKQNTDPTHHLTECNYYF